MAAPTDPILRWLRECEPRMFDDLRAIVSLDSPSLEPELVNRCIAFVESRCRDLGASIERIHEDGLADRLRAVWPGRPGAPRVVLVVHVDTVWPADESSRRPFRIEGGRAHGPGVFDMKGGVVQTLWALRALRENGRWPSTEIVLLATGDEELGSVHSRALIEDEARRSAVACVMEPPEHGAIKTARKGVGMFEIEVEGRAAHAGAQPEKGVSATVELAHQTLRLAALTDFDRGTTVNVGVIAGGSRRNVVAAAASALVDLRVRTMAEAERVVPQILGLQPVLPSARVTVTGGLNRPPMERTPAIVGLYQRARAIAAELGFELEERSTGGASDGNFTAAVGTPTLDGLGSVGDGGHAVTEYVELSEMAPRAALLARFLEEPVAAEADGANP